MQACYKLGVLNWIIGADLPTDIYGLGMHDDAPFMPNACM